MIPLRILLLIVSFIFIIHTTASASGALEVGAGFAHYAVDYADHLSSATRYESESYIFGLLTAGAYFSLVTFGEDFAIGIRPDITAGKGGDAHTMLQGGASLMVKYGTDATSLSPLRYGCGIGLCRQITVLEREGYSAFDMQSTALVLEGNMMVGRKKPNMVRVRFVQDLMPGKRTYNNTTGTFTGSSLYLTFGYML